MIYFLTYSRRLKNNTSLELEEIERYLCQLNPFLLESFATVVLPFLGLYIDIIRGSFTRS